MQKLIINKTDTESLREYLKDLVDNKIRLKRKELADKLSRMYPLSGWSERVINHLLSDAKIIDGTKALQIVNFCYPQNENEDPTIDDLRDKLNETRELMNKLELELVASLNGDKILDENETRMLEIRKNMITEGLERFSRLARKVVGVKLSYRNV